MPKYFQWITLLLIESIYFARIRVKGPHTSVWIIPSKPSNLWEARLRFQSIGPLGSVSKLQIHRTSGKSKFQSIGPLRSTSKLQTIEPLRSTTNFKSIGPLGSTSKLQTIRPLGSTSKFQIHRTFQSIGPLGSTSKIQFQWTSMKHI